MRIRPYKPRNYSIKSKAHRNEWLRKQRLLREIRGLCTRCGKRPPEKKGRTRCGPCRIYHRIYNLKYVEEHPHSKLIIGVTDKQWYRLTGERR